MGRAPPPFGPRNIRPPFQQLRRYANGDRWRWRCERQCWKTETGWRSADQYRKRVLELGPGDSDIDHLRSGGFEDRPGLLHFDFGSKASVVSVQIQLQRLFVLRNRVLQQLFFSIQRAGCKVIDSQVGMQAQVHYSQIRGAGLRLRAGRLHITTDASPRLCLVGQIKRKGEVIKSNAIEY